MLDGLSLRLFLARQSTPNIEKAIRTHYFAPIFDKYLPRTVVQSHNTHVTCQRLVPAALESRAGTSSIRYKQAKTI